MYSQARSDWSGQSGHGLTTFGPQLTFDLSIQCYWDVFRSGFCYSWWKDAVMAFY